MAVQSDRFDFLNCETSSLDIVSERSTDRSRVDHAELDKGKARTWLEDTLKLSSETDPENSTSRMRLLIYRGSVSEGTIPADFKTSIFSYLKMLNIPSSQIEFNEDLVHLRNYSSTSMSLLEEQAGGENALAYVLTTIYFGIAWKQYSTSPNVVGVLWYWKERNFTSTARLVVERCIQHQQKLFHPHLISVFILEVLAKHRNQQILLARKEIIQAQLDSGYHAYATGVIGKMNEGTDLAKLSARVCGASTNMAAHRLSFQGLRTLASTVMSENDYIVLNHPDHQVSEQVRNAIIHHTKTWLHECNMLIEKATCWERIAATVIQGIFNMIAQADQRASIEIARQSKTISEQSQKTAAEATIFAEQSKKDSTSMKAIAAVTVIFLPGTFVASFFAMPFFDLDNASQLLVSHEQWLYWSVTVPLTLITIIAWQIWDYMSSKRQTQLFKERKQI